MLRCKSLKKAKTESFGKAVVYTIYKITAAVCINEFFLRPPVIKLKKVFLLLIFARINANIELGGAMRPPGKHINR